MFNSAFLLMYLIGIVGYITPILTAAACLVIVLAGGWYIGFCDESNLEERQQGMGTCRTYVILASILFILAAAVPSKIALYAGAGQYVVEVAEIDDTLIGLRDLIDAKITELTIDSLESSADQVLVDVTATIND